VVDITASELRKNRQAIVPFTEQILMIHCRPFKIIKLNFRVVRVGAGRMSYLGYTFAEGGVVSLRSSRKSNSSNRLTVAFQGELGAFSHAAALQLLGQNVEPRPYPAFRDVFEALKANRVTHAVVPIENTLHGSILENYDNLLQYEFPIRGETSVRISHQLIAMAGTRFRDVKRAFSHPVALNQCRHFFEQNPSIQATTFYDTAGSVKMLKEEMPAGAAAIASESAAKIYSGVIVKRNIEDNRHNYTRFFLLTKQKNVPVQAKQPWKTSVVFSTANTPGTLFKAMACFALRDLSLTKIESRPLVGHPWEYIFYADFLGSATDPAVKNALANLSEVTQICRVLGSYQPTI
jgi:prephenate dehydratase